jgi:uncharacterized protein
MAALFLTNCAAEANTVTGQEPALALTGRVVDAADILSPNFERELTAKLMALEEDTKVQLVVASTPNLNGETIESYSLNLANAWGIGSADRNDGLMLLVAPNDRQVRIEVGLGLEDTVRNEEAQIIIDTRIVPQFRNGRYELGVDQAVDSLIDEVTPIEMKEAA